MIAKMYKNNKNYFITFLHILKISTTLLKLGDILTKLDELKNTASLQADSFGPSKGLWDILKLVCPVSDFFNARRKG